ncbi:MAG: hypothetical protein MJZ68_10115, partial [archaeon]|nr:hypothetical protein [archaeon]
LGDKGVTDDLYIIPVDVTYLGRVETFDLVVFEDGGEWHQVSDFDTVYGLLSNGRTTYLHWSHDRYVYAAAMGSDGRFHGPLVVYFSPAGSEIQSYTISLDSSNVLHMDGTVTNNGGYVRDYAVDRVSIVQVSESFEEDFVFTAGHHENVGDGNERFTMTVTNLGRTELSDLSVAVLEDNGADGFWPFGVDMDFDRDLKNNPIEPGESFTFIVTYTNVPDCKRTVQLTAYVNGTAYGVINESTGGIGFDLVP